MYTLKRVPEVESLDGSEAEIYFNLVNDELHERFIDNNYVSKIQEYLPKSGIVLDVGCGPGQIPLKIVENNPSLNVIGLDLSNRMVDIANEIAKNSPYPNNLSYMVGDASKMSFDDDSLDGVISHFFVEHLPNEEKVIDVFNEIQRVVKPNGMIYVEDIVRPPSEELLQIYLDRATYDSNDVMKNYEDSLRAAFSHGEWSEMLNRSNIVKPKKMDEGIIYKSETGLISFNGLPTFQYFVKFPLILK